MNETEEKRICQKCGKRLPSSNNFCMYCGYNNNLNDEELESLKSINANNIHTQKKQELLNKSINARDREIVIRKGKKDTPINNEIHEERPDIKNTMLTNLLYVIILIDVIFISAIISFKNDGLLFEKFNYNLDKYEKIINIDNDSFLGLKDNKIELIGESNILNNKELKKINKGIVLDIAETYPDSKKIVIKTDEKLFLISSTYSYYKEDSKVEEKKLKNPSDNLYKDLNNEVLGKVNTNDDYYVELDNNFFIKDGALYSNNSDKQTNFFSGYYDKKKEYSSKMVLDNIKLNMDNPEIIHSSPSSRTVIIKGDNIIKVFTDGVLIQSIKSITSNNKTYNIDDFKYIFNDGYKFLLVCKNGAKINYNYNSRIIDYAEEYGTTSKVFKSIYKNEINKNIDVDKSSSFSSYYLEDTKDENAIVSYVKHYWKFIVAALVAFIFLVGVIYATREKGFVLSTVIYSLVILAYFLIYMFYSVSHVKDPDYLEALKASIDEILSIGIIGLMLAQIKEVVNYILDKFNIETIYHFILLLISLFALILAISVLGNSIYILLIVPGILWAFLTLNDEYYVRNEVDNKVLGELLVTAFASIIIGLIICTIFNICNYYLCILVAAFSIACFMVLNNNVNIKTCIKNFINGNLNLLLSLLLIIIYAFMTMMQTSGVSQELADIANKYIFHSLVVTSLVLIGFLIVISIILGIVIYIVNLITKNIISKIKNRVLRVFIYMFILVILLSIVVIAIPWIEELYIYVCNLINGEDSSYDSLISMFSSII